MKNIIKFICLSLVLVMCVAVFAACGDKNGTDTKSTDTAAGTKAADDTKAAEVSGEKQTWGEFTVLVPSGMTLKGGDMLNADATDAFTLSMSDNESKQLRFSIEDEETCTSSVDTTKEMNEDSNPEDVEFTAGGVTWKGVAYVYAGTSPCFQIYGEVNGRFVLVGSSYIAYDDAAVTAALGSLEVAPAK
jgi:hypothetical protein